MLLFVIEICISILKALVKEILCILIPYVCFQPRILFHKGNIISSVFALFIITTFILLDKSELSGGFKTFIIFNTSYQRFIAILFELLNILLNFAFDLLFDLVFVKLLKFFHRCETEVDFLLELLV